MVRCFGVGDMNLSESTVRSQIGVIFTSAVNSLQKVNSYNKAAALFLSEQRNSSQKSSSFLDIRLDPG